jgi:hypothetical protein
LCLSQTAISLPAGKPCITDTAEECQKCLNARLSMVDKKLKPGVWGDPPSFRQTINPVATRAASSSSGTGSGGGRGMRTWAPVSAAAAAASAGGLRSLHTSSIAGQQPAVAAAISTAAPGAPAGIPGSSSSFASGPAKGSDVPRTNIGIFGCMNAGKSSLMNRITRSEFSIVDSTPGTTADTKVALMELHDLGPAKLFDTGGYGFGAAGKCQGTAGRRRVWFARTASALVLLMLPVPNPACQCPLLSAVPSPAAGIDEAGELGEKKRRKVLSVLKETDVAVVVVDVARFARWAGAGVVAWVAVVSWARGWQLLLGCTLSRLLLMWRPTQMDAWLNLPPPPLACCLPLSCSTPEGELLAALAWERLLLDKAGAAGSTAVLVYNTKRTFSTPAPDAAAAAAATVPRLQAVLNPDGTLASQQLELSREEASDPLAAFLQAAAAEAKQHEAVPRSLPEEYLSGGCEWGREQQGWDTAAELGCRSYNSLLSV